MNFRLLLMVAILCSLQSTIYSQTPGIIVRPGGTAGPAVLDPNQDGYTSTTFSGFAGDDILNSEIKYKVVAPVTPEPSGDLLRGPGSSFSDIVKTLDGSGFYLFSDGTNLLCRLRIGSIVSGSKGYSVLLDTDQKFGPSGPNADPNYQPATNGNNGNPGFEFEIVMETNSRVAVYNVDGTSSPVLVTSFSILNNSQVSVAATTEANNLDFFYDFYVPYSVMGLTAASSIRATATTVMSPSPAIGGPKSDIYGLSGNNYMNDWTEFINDQPPFTIGSLTIGGTGVGPVCTKAPVVNQPVSPSSTTVTGTWTKASTSSVTTAKIILYNGLVAIDSVTVTSGNTWSINVSSLPQDAIITAKARAAGESFCLTSNEVIVNACNASTHTATPVITCSSDRGMEGTRASGASVTLYKITSLGYSLYADDATTTYRVTYPSATTWRYDDLNTQSGSACTGGATDIATGSYAAVAKLSPACASAPLIYCISGTAAPSTPVITSSLTDGATQIKGTATSGASVALWIDGFYVQSVTAAGGSFGFTLATKLSLNQQVSLVCTTTGSCSSGAVTGTVSCFVDAPVIITDISGKIAADVALNGTSGAGTGSTITVYNSSTLAVMGTTTVNSSGKWLLASPLAVAGTSYIAKVTGHTCGNSFASNLAAAIANTTGRCGSINDPVFENTTAVTGILNGSVTNTRVSLYIDGQFADSVNVSGNSFSIPVNTTLYNKIYAGAELSIGIKEYGKAESFCPPGKNVFCTAPGTPSVSPLTIDINAGQTVTYSITPAVSGILYALRNNTDSTDLGGAGFGSGANMTLTTLAFNTPGTYSVMIKAISLSGDNCFSATYATVNVTGVLPLTVLNFTGKYDRGTTNLNWQTTAEVGIHYFDVERSRDGRTFSKIGTVQALGSGNGTRQYTLTDPSMDADVMYYRLKITDNSIQGYVYSNIVVVKVGASISVNQVMPNPFAEYIKLGFYSNNAGGVTVYINDLTGKKVMERTYLVRKGDNQLTVSGLNALAAGGYVIEILKDNVKQFHQILIRK